MERLLMKGWGSAVWRWLPAVAAVVGVLGLLWVIVVVAPPDQPAASAPIEQVPKLQVRAPDVQASLWVLGRGGFARALGHDRWLDLSGVDLRRADLRDAHLSDVDFRFAGLQKAYLAGADLQGADLGGSHLAGAYLGGAQLDRATLDGAHLEGAVADDRTAWPDGFNWRAAGVAPAR